MSTTEQLVSQLGQDKFVKQMQKAATQLGMSDTQTPSNTQMLQYEYFDSYYSGYTTARDIAKLERAAMDIPLFQTIVQTSSYKANGKGKAHYYREKTAYNANIYTWTNGNYLIAPKRWESANPKVIAYATGIKGGYQQENMVLFSADELAAIHTKNGRCSQTMIIHYIGVVFLEHTYYRSEPSTYAAYMLVHFITPS